jgi:hypothetical protein
MIRTPICYSNTKTNLSFSLHCRFFVLQILTRTLLEFHFAFLHLKTHALPFKSLFRDLLLQLICFIFKIFDLKTTNTNSIRRTPLACASSYIFYSPSTPNLHYPNVTLKYLLCLFSIYPQDLYFVSVKRPIAPLGSPWC